MGTPSPTIRQWSHSTALAGSTPLLASPRQAHGLPSQASPRSCDAQKDSLWLGQHNCRGNSLISHSTITTSTTRDITCEPLNELLDPECTRLVIVIIIKGRKGLKKKRFLYANTEELLLVSLLFAALDVKDA